MGEIMTRYEEYREALREELARQADSFVRTGYLLRLAIDTDVLRNSGYGNVNEFAKEEFGLDASMVSRYININMRFSEGGYSERIAAPYEGMGYAKLSLMLLLPDSIAEELSPEYSKAEVQEIKEEYEAEQKVSDIEVMLEERDAAQEALETNLQKAVYQLLHDEKELFRKIFNIPEGLGDEEYDKHMQEILAPQSAACYSIRIQGVGRLMLFVKGTDTDLSLTNIRSGEKERYSWRELEMAWDKVREIAAAEGTTAEEAWEGIYGEPFGEKEEIAPVQQKRPEQRKQSRVVKAPEKKAPAAGAEPGQQEGQPAAGAEGPEDDQLPGQTSIEEDFPEYMPETDTKNSKEQPEGMDELPQGSPENPESRIKTECGGDSAEVPAGESGEPAAGTDRLSKEELREISDRIWKSLEEVTEIMVDLTVKERKDRSAEDMKILEEMYKKTVSMAADAERMLNG